MWHSYWHRPPQTVRMRDRRVYWCQQSHGNLRIARRPSQISRCTAMHAVDRDHYCCCRSPSSHCFRCCCVVVDRFLDRMFRREWRRNHRSPKSIGRSCGRMCSDGFGAVAAVPGWGSMDASGLVDSGRTGSSSGQPFRFARVAVSAPDFEWIVQCVSNPVRRIETLSFDSSFEVGGAPARLALDTRPAPSACLSHLRPNGLESNRKQFEISFTVFKYQSRIKWLFCSRQFRNASQSNEEAQKSWCMISHFAVKCIARRLTMFFESSGLVTYCIERGSIRWQFLFQFRRWRLRQKKPHRSVDDGLPLANIGDLTVAKPCLS